MGHYMAVDQIFKDLGRTDYTLFTSQPVERLFVQMTFPGTGYISDYFQIQQDPSSFLYGKLSALSASEKAQIDKAYKASYEKFKHLGGGQQIIPPPN
jgi:hypothetical protein